MHEGEEVMNTLRLVSHDLCPYVQRAAIAMIEKQMPFERVDVDLRNKPAWFKAISPLGKTPVLQVGDTAVFESAVILEFLEDTGPRPLHPADPLLRAEHRSWIEFGSSILNDIAGLYAAKDRAAFETKHAAIAEKIARVEQRLDAAPYFDGERFSLVDAVYAPIFRYFDVFDTIADLGIFAQTPKARAWRAVLATRYSVGAAVSPDYPQRLRAFLRARGSHLSRLM
jgi:glutathione S-transferase